MKTPTNRSSCVLACAGIVVFSFFGGVQALASPFQNLNFEDAVIGTPVDRQLPASEALPYWDNNNYVPGHVFYDYGPSLYGLGAIAAVTVADRFPHTNSIFALEGQYSIMLTTGAGAPPTDAWISQTGDVPAGVRSIMFSSDDMGGGNLVVSLNGTPIPVSLYSTGPVVNDRFGPVQTYIGDVSAFAGQQDVVLRFALVPTAGMTDLDAVSFSTVPEPSSLALAAISTVTTCLYLLRRRVAGR